MTGTLNIWLIMNVLLLVLFRYSLIAPHFKHQVIQPSGWQKVTPQSQRAKCLLMPILWRPVVRSTTRRTLGFLWISPNSPRSVQRDGKWVGCDLGAVCFVKTQKLYTSHVGYRTAVQSSRCLDLFIFVVLPWFALGNNKTMVSQAPWWCSGESHILKRDSLAMLQRKNLVHWLK